MGRNLTWYALSTDITHEPTKTLCFNLECEPDKGELDDLDNKIIKLLKPGDSIEDCTNMNAIIWDCKTGAERTKLWCQKCLMFTDGISFTAHVRDNFDVSHSYSNPTWISPWNITNICIGECSSPFINAFDRIHHNYFEITALHLNHAFATIKRLGMPVRLMDKDAHCESIRVLGFIERWLMRANIRVVMEDNR